LKRRNTIKIKLEIKLNRFLEVFNNFLDSYYESVKALSYTQAQELKEKETMQRSEGAEILQESSRESIII
jgi:hypothetical protein